MEFKVGDVVEWNGRKGIVDSEHDYGGVFEIRVLFDHDQSGTWPFYKDGTLPTFKDVVLKLIERPEAK